MLSRAVQDLRQRKQQIAQQIKQLESEARKLEKAITVLLSLSEGAGAKGAAPAGKRRRKMSLLGRLRIKLGSLNRYGKKEAAKKLAAKIAQLESKTVAK